MVRGLLEWSPDPLRDVLAFLERFTVDSARYVGGVDGQEALEFDAARLGNAAEPFRWSRGGDLVAGFKSWHVTDDPSAVIRALEAGDDLMETGRRAGPPWLCRGLFVSGSPGYWRRRVSLRMYGFLEELSGTSLRDFAGHVQMDLARKAGSGYITRSECQRPRPKGRGL